MKTKGFTMHPKSSREELLKWKMPHSKLHQQFHLKDLQLHELASSGEMYFTAKGGDVKISKLKSKFHLDAREKPKLPISDRV